MRKLYLDNIRWITILLVVIFHSFYYYNNIDVVNITLHFFLKDIRPMLPPAMNHSIAVS
ncbi:hypothetical protein [Anaerostipes sp. 494a]|uniref:hypothetical protein n=1 Tax=Anaerostipes sp. 494a TaxID=1261636 RepID=UPI00178CA2DF|nr:hypothetical protein [Anaerostipes sp. 494a]